VVTSDIHYSKGSSYSHNTNEDDEEDEQPRPPKRQKQHLKRTHMAPLGPNSKACRRQSRSATPPLVAQLKVNNTQPHTNHEHPPTPVDNQHPYNLQDSQSPSIVEPALVTVNADLE
jgi:hypothetical protein